MNSSDNHSIPVLVHSPAQGVKSCGVEVHTTVTTRSTTSRGRDCQPNTVGSAPGGRPASEDAAEPWASSAVVGPPWVSPGRPSPASVHAGPGLRRRRPGSHGPAPRPHRPSPRPGQAPGISPSSGSPTSRDRRNPVARGLGRYLAPRGGGPGRNRGTVDYRSRQPLPRRLRRVLG